MEIKTATTTVYTVELSDADVGEILADPAAFQRRLRELRNGLAAKGPNARKSIKIGKRSDPKGATALRSAKPSGPTRTPCKLCGKPLTAKGVTRHLRQSHPDAATAEIA